MTEQNAPEAETVIPDEAKFLSALGVNPGNVLAGTVKIEWPQGDPHITFQSIFPVTPKQLGLAFLAADSSPQEPSNVTKMPTDRKASTKKTPAKKTTAPRRRTTKGEGGGNT